MPLLDKLRKLYGVGPVCSELHIAPSTYYHCQQQRHHPDKRSARAQRDDWLKKEIQRVYDENHKVWRLSGIKSILEKGLDKQPVQDPKPALLSTMEHENVRGSEYYHCQQQRHHPDKRSARAQRDDWLKKEIQRVYDENHKVYGVRKVWRQLLREGIRVARCTVARLMAVMGLAGGLRGKKVRTTICRKAVAAGDRVNRQFVAERPDQLWVADFTYGVPGVQGGHGCLNEPRVCLEY